MAACCQAFNTDFKTVLSSWEDGSLSESYIYGGLLHIASNGRSLADFMSGNGPSSSLYPSVYRQEVGKGITRERTSASSPEQIMSQGGLLAPDVNMIQDLFSRGLPPGVPPEELFGE